jgi:hypothetical protein
MTGRIVVVAVGFLAVGCCRPESHADATQFPDFSKYVAANVADYQVDASTPGHRASQVVFLTPDGITCAFSSPPSAGCTGNDFPGVPPAASGVNSIATDAKLDTTNAPISGTDAKALPPFHTLTVDGVVCGVDDARTTACRDARGRGFVLSPKGSGWLEHV